MGAKQSSAAAAAAVSASSPAPLANANAAPVKLAPFKHAVMLHGLRGSGKSSIQSALSIPAGRTLEVPVEFLTSPPVYSTHWGGNNHPSRADGKLDESLWTYGGRGSINSVWSVVSYACKAQILVVDSTAVHTLAPSLPAPAPIPDSRVQGWADKSPADKAAILAELQERMTTKGVLDRLQDHNSYGWERRPLLVLATKQDLPGAMSTEAIAEALGLASLETMDWRVQGCNAVSGEGLADAFAWLNYVIATPTDFTRQREAKQKKMNEEWERQRKERATRERRLKAGHVIRAPEPYPKQADGSAWEVSPDFIVAPLSPDDEDHEPVVPSTANTTLVAVVAPAAAAAKVAEFVDLNSVNLDAAAAAERDSSVKEQAQREVSSNARTEQSVSGKSDSVDGPQETSGDSVLEAVVSKDEENAAPLSSKYQSLNSAMIVLPAPNKIPETAYVMRRKHWYSKKKMMPAKPEPLVEDIHKIHRWGGFGLM